jgi:hypothetical protein
VQASESAHRQRTAARPRPCSPECLASAAHLPPAARAVELVADGAGPQREPPRRVRHAGHVLVCAALGLALRTAHGAVRRAASAHVSAHASTATARASRPPACAHLPPPCSQVRRHGGASRRTLRAGIHRRTLRPAGPPRARGHLLPQHHLLAPPCPCAPPRARPAAHAALSPQLDRTFDAWIFRTLLAAGAYIA